MKHSLGHFIGYYSRIGSGHPVHGCPVQGRLHARRVQQGLHDTRKLCRYWNLPFSAFQIPWFAPENRIGSKMCNDLWLKREKF